MVSEARVLVLGMDSHCLVVQRAGASVRQPEVVQPPVCMSREAPLVLVWNASVAAHPVLESIVLQPMAMALSVAVVPETVE
jgi:hypothetical protein